MKKNFVLQQCCIRYLPFSDLKEYRTSYFGVKLHSVNLIWILGFFLCLVAIPKVQAQAVEPKDQPSWEISLSGTIQKLTVSAEDNILIAEGDFGKRYIDIAQREVLSSAPNLSQNNQQSLWRSPNSQEMNLVAYNASISKIKPESRLIESNDEGIFVKGPHEAGFINKSGQLIYFTEFTPTKTLKTKMSVTNTNNKVQDARKKVGKAAKWGKLGGKLLGSFVPGMKEVTDVIETVDNVANNSAWDQVQKEVDSKFSYEEILAQRSSNIKYYPNHAIFITALEGTRTNLNFYINLYNNDPSKGELVKVVVLNKETGIEEMAVVASGQAPILEVDEKNRRIFVASGKNSIQCYEWGDGSFDLRTTTISDNRSTQSDNSIMGSWEFDEIVPNNPMNTDKDFLQQKEMLASFKGMMKLEFTEDGSLIENLLTDNSSQNGKWEQEGEITKAKMDNWEERTFKIVNGKLYLSRSDLKYNFVYHKTSGNRKTISTLAGNTDSKFSNNMDALSTTYEELSPVYFGYIEDNKYVNKYHKLSMSLPNGYTGISSQTETKRMLSAGSVADGKVLADGKCFVYLYTQKFYEEVRPTLIQVGNTMVPLIRVTFRGKTASCSISTEDLANRPEIGDGADYLEVQRKKWISGSKTTTEGASSTTLTFTTDKECSKEFIGSREYFSMNFNSSSTTTTTVKKKTTTSTVNLASGKWYCTFNDGFAYVISVNKNIASTTEDKSESSDSMSRLLKPINFKKSTVKADLTNEEQDQIDQVEEDQVVYDILQSLIFEE